MAVQNILNNKSLSDFTVGGTSGSLASLAIDNNNNTASTISRCLLRVGGTTASDVYDAWVNGTTISYSQGVDNSDSQAFKITTSADANASPSSSNIILNSRSSGEIAYPLQSAFFAIRSADVTNFCGDGADYTMIEDSEIYDQNSDYDTGTGTFTAPVTGQYLFTYTATFKNMSSGHNLISMQIVTSNINGVSSRIDPFAYRNNTTGEATFSCSGVFNMDAADTCFLRVNITGGTKTVTLSGDTTNGETAFGGFLVA